ncbi:MAG: BstXI family restriction endonuclease [Succiniclasticum sp.]|uniref:BstXI family restriction endonuclease n=1 Tax=Succiniclasticum sp. TaxID=2775030 RepID=UPI002A91F77D|nr:BstXI family restriction endonuclease [Succiniclasticum sp.]MDY6292002.1 BstXI family restriction endonuclease [Succiniclasticum sp.]
MNAKKKEKAPALPALLNRKISKTGQTRGADDDVIYQNRVNRCNTVLIPFHQWKKDSELRKISSNFENGFIVLIQPQDYFSQSDPTQMLSQYALELGENCLVFYETRHDWNTHNPQSLGWECANNRNAPLGGNYVARVPATTASHDSGKINHGYASQSPKGAGIRLYEYASSDTINNCRSQLEAIYWLCFDSVEVAIKYGMTKEGAEKRRELCFKKCEELGLLDYERLFQQRIINKKHRTICPFCLKELSGNGFYNRLEQAEGREVPDLTVTQINLFHIDELKYGEFNHRPYNLGWGHHHCNVVVKDSGIYPTLHWIKEILDRNSENGYEVK